MDILFNGFVVVIVLLVVSGSVFWCVGAWVDGKNRAAPTVFAVIVWSLFFGILIQHEQESPCVKYEESLQYNAATKTMMPMRVCVERGEWVDE